MSKEKQIKEMALDICKSRLVAEEGDYCRKCKNDNNCLYQEIAYGLYNADYRKKNEGEWKQSAYGELKCSVCGIVQEDNPHRYNFCPQCGAKMKGGE